MNHPGPVQRLRRNDIDQNGSSTCSDQCDIRILGLETLRTSRLKRIIDNEVVELTNQVPREQEFRKRVPERTCAKIAQFVAERLGFAPYEGQQLYRVIDTE